MIVEHSIEDTGRTERLVFLVLAEIDVVEARQQARVLAERHGFSRVRAYGLATAVSELANNLVFHAANGGRIILSTRDWASGKLIEFVVKDDGPGIADLALAMEDGYSTAGSLGCGLPGTKRLVDRFVISSSLGKGTCIECAITRT